MNIIPPSRPATGQGATFSQTWQTAWRLTLLCCALLFLGVIGYLILSIMRAVHGTDQPEAAAAVVAPLTSSSEAMPTEAALPASPASGGPPDISKEFEIMRQREEGQKETIRIIRKEARENPDANNPSEEQLKEMEQSGALVM